MRLNEPGETAHVETLAIRGVGLADQGVTEYADQSSLRAGLEGLDEPDNQRYPLCVGWVALREVKVHTAYREFEDALPA